MITQFTGWWVDIARLPAYDRHYLDQGVAGGSRWNDAQPNLDRVIGRSIVARPSAWWRAGSGVCGCRRQTHDKVIRTLTRWRGTFPGIVRFALLQPPTRRVCGSITAIARARIAGSWSTTSHIGHRSISRERDPAAPRELPNMSASRTSSGTTAQSLDRLAGRPDGFSVLTGKCAVLRVL